MANPFFSIGNSDGKERILGSAAELIGWTPLVETKRISAKEGALARIIAKLEGYQPGCSVKDRIALSMIVDAENKGILIPGESTIVEPTSGNTGIALALVAALRGYKVIALMPSTYSMERRIILRAFGAELILTDPSLGLPLLFGKAREIAPDVTDTKIIDEIVTVNTEEALDWSRRLASEEGLLVGISSGAAFAAALKIAKRAENSGKMIVVIFPSAGERYLTTPLFAGIREECEKLVPITS